MSGETFWTDGDPEHQALAEEFYKNIEMTHPDVVTSDRLVPPWFSWDTWNTTSVEYPEYRGPRVTNL